MNGLQVAGIAIIVIVIAALVGAGVFTIRKGVQALPNAETLGQEPLWHKQPNILLGISNICFAILVGLVVLVSFETSSTGKIITFVLIALVFLLSIFLVVRTATSALNAVKKLSKKRADKGQ